MSRLVVDRLCKRFGGVVAARDVAFSVAAGELVAMIGPNGAGKSTTFNIVGGQLRPDTGEVRLDGERISGLPARTVAARGVGRTFQIAETFQSMTVAENVQMALMGKAGEGWSLWSRAHPRHREKAIDLLGLVGMAARADTATNALAYGDIKRVEIALALAGDPKLLLMDEPTAGMAPPERAQLMRLVAAIARERQIAVLFTEHDMDAVFGFADRVLVLVRGEIIAAGRPDEVRADPQVKRVYLGDMGTDAALKAVRNEAVAS